jgi:hypothetical protein
VKRIALCAEENLGGGKFTGFASWFLCFVRPSYSTFIYTLYKPRNYAWQERDRGRGQQNVQFVQKQQNSKLNCITLDIEHIHF